MEGIGGKVLYVVFAVILIVAVAIPVTSSAIDSANLTGTASTVVGFIPLFLAIAGLAVVAALIVL
jgi:hypothetical protein